MELILLVELEPFEFIKVMTKLDCKIRLCFQRINLETVSILLIIDKHSSDDLIFVLAANL